MRYRRKLNPLAAVVVLLVVVLLLSRTQRNDERKPAAQPTANNERQADEEVGSGDPTYLAAADGFEFLSQLFDLLL